MIFISENGTWCLTMLCKGSSLEPRGVILAINWALERRPGFLFDGVSLPHKQQALALTQGPHCKCGVLGRKSEDKGPSLLGSKSVKGNLWPADRSLGLLVSPSFTPDPNS